MSSLYVVIHFLFLMNYSEAQSHFCPVLETVPFASRHCVPTQEETCHSGQPGNCELTGATVECKYVRGPGVHIIKNELDSGFNCVAHAPDVCDYSGEYPVCTPGPCIQYSSPRCEQTCKQCYLEELDPIYEPLRGCKKFCAEESCQDEPRCDPDPCQPGEPCNQNRGCRIKEIADPNGGAPFVLPANIMQACGNDSPCPTTKVPPSYVTPGNCPSCQFNPDGSVNVIISGVQSCTPKPIVKDNSPIQNDACPWIDYVKRQPACEAVAIGNRFPQDCCQCTHNQSVTPTVPCKACPGITEARCNN